MFSNPFPHAFGLDISDLSIKAVYIRNASFWHRAPHYELVTNSSITLPHGLIVNGEIQKPEAVREYIKKLLAGKENKKKAIRSNWAVISLPNSQSFIKHLIIPKPTDEILTEDVIHAAQKHIPFDPDGYYFDWQVIPKSIKGTITHNDTASIILGAAPKNIANSYTYLAESLGLGVAALEIEAIAITRAMVTAQKEYIGEARAILDLGATKTCLIIHDKDALQFSISLPFSGELVTTTMSQKLGITYEEAEKRKITNGLNCEKNPGQTFQVIAGAVDELAENIKKALEFYYSHFPESNKITRIVMCGGSANICQLASVLSMKLKIAAHPGRPWKNLMNKNTDKLGQQVGLSYATAIGLALRAAGNPFFTKDMI